MFLNLRSVDGGPTALLGVGLPGVIFLAILTYCIYQRFFSPLAKFPGPFLASITAIWFARMQTLPDHHRRLIALHEKYGPVVRVKPNKLSISSPEAYKTIYSAGTGFIKGEMYVPMKGKRTFDLTGERNEKVHGHQRRLVSRAYTMDTMKGLEPYVNTTIKVFLDKLEEVSKDGRVVDLSYWIQLFAFDVIGEVTFARPFGYLATGTDAGLFASIGAAIRSIAWVGEVPWVASVNAFIAPLFGSQLALKARNGSLHAFTLAAIAARKQRAGTADDHEGDILSKLFAARRERDETRGGLSEGDIGFMLTSNVMAGSDTTSISLCAMVHLLLTHPPALARLMRELRERVESGEIEGGGVVTQAQAERWPYLQAVMYEALRLHPAVGGLLSRVVPEGGLRFGDTFVPGGVEVGCSAWVVQREKSVYGEDAEAFRPERWLDEEKKHEMRKFKTCSKLEGMRVGLTERPTF